MSMRTSNSRTGRSRISPRRSSSTTLMPILSLTAASSKATIKSAGQGDCRPQHSDQTRSIHDGRLCKACGGLCPKKNNTRAALADLNTAIGRKSDLESAYVYRGIIRLNTGDNVDAVADFNKAFQLDPQDAKALYGRGLAKYRNGDATGGDADMAAAKALDADVEKGLH